MWLFFFALICKNIKQNRYICMIIINTSDTTHTIYCIPRVKTQDISVEMTDDITGEIFTAVADPTISYLGDYTKIDLEFENANNKVLEDSTFYTLRVVFNALSEVIYKDKVFGTSQSINQALRQEYDINKNVYQEEQTIENDYIII